MNNVGTNIRKASIEYDDAEIDKIMSTNLHSAFDFCRMAYPLLKASGDASIVNISSVAGVVSMRTGVMSLLLLFCLFSHSDVRSVGWMVFSTAGRITVLFAISGIGVVYGMTKAAMNHMTKILACEWGKEGIRVNSVSPWYVIYISHYIDYNRFVVIVFLFCSFSEQVYSYTSRGSSYQQLRVHGRR